jgi:hypothetical protein
MSISWRTLTAIFRSERVFNEHYVQQAEVRCIDSSMASHTKRWRCRPYQPLITRERLTVDSADQTGGGRAAHETTREMLISCPRKLGIHARAASTGSNCVNLGLCQRLAPSARHGASCNCICLAGGPVHASEIAFPNRLRPPTGTRRAILGATIPRRVFLALP